MTSFSAGTGCIDRDSDDSENNSLEGTSSDGDQERAEDTIEREVDTEDLQLTVYQEQFHVDSPWGSELGLTDEGTSGYARSLIVESEEKRRIELEVYDGDTLLYSLEADLMGEYYPLEIGYRGSYVVRAKVDGHEREGTWKVGEGFSDLYVETESTRDGRTVPSFRQEPFPGRISATKVAGFPDNAEVMEYDSLASYQVIEDVFEHWDDCAEDHERDGCTYPTWGKDQLGWEEGGEDFLIASIYVEGEEHTDAHRALQGHEYYQDFEAQHQGYLPGYYVRREDQAYTLKLDDGNWSVY